MRSPWKAVGVVALVALVVLPSAASAQSKPGQGSSLTAAANYPYHCDYRWTAGYDGQPGAFGPGGAQEYVPQQIGESTCSLAHLGLDGRPDTSHLVPGTGNITVARVKSGPNPAPISIATVRSFQGRDQQGNYSNTCCQGVSETPTVNPTPNGITEIPVNFRVEATQFDPNSNRAGWHDWIVVNVHGTTGTLPIHDNGEPKPFAASTAPAANDHSMFWHFGQIDPSQHNQNRWTAPGFEVLMNYDWCPAAAPAQARMAQAGCATQGAPAAGAPTGTAPAPQAPLPQQTPAPKAALASVLGSRLTLRGSTVALRVKCNATRPCAGRVRLKTRARRARTLGTQRIRIAAGKTSTVKVRLSKSNRRRVNRRGLPATVEIDLGSNGKLTQDVTLRRLS